MVTYEIPLYRSLVQFTRSRKEFAAALADVGSYPDVSGMAGGVQELPHGNYIMGVFDRSLSTLVHECAHLALSVVRNAGFQAEDGNQEPFCYLLGELVAHFHKEKA